MNCHDAIGNEAMVSTNGETSKARKSKEVPLRSEAEKQKRREWADANREKLRGYRAAWDARNPEKKEARRRRWRMNNRAAFLASSQRSGRKWRQENPDKVMAKTAMRRAQKRLATVPWADRAAMLAIYRDARRLTRITGVDHQVDHIVPLQSRVVCGLHNEFNLQVLTAGDNRRKQNRFPMHQGD